MLWYWDNMRVFPVIRKDTRLNQKIEVSGDEMEYAVSLNIRAEIPSGPVEVLDGI